LNRKNTKKLQIVRENITIILLEKVELIHQ
jgi:hypothetical protein